MYKSKTLARRMEEVLLNGTWIANTNFKAQLDGLDWQITLQSFGNLNTIAALAQHVHYYVAGIKQVLEGGELTIQDKYSFYFPPIKSAKDWQNFLAKFWEDAEKTVQVIDNLTDEELAADFANKKYGTCERNINAIIEHSYYHLAQIVLLKKIMIEQKKD